MDWDNTNKKRKRDADSRREKAAKEFESAAALAHCCPGLIMKKCSHSHYQLIRYHPDQDRRWILNIYPGNHRLYSDKNIGSRFYLKVASPWTLISVVEAAISQLCKETKRGTIG